MEDTASQPHSSSQDSPRTTITTPEIPSDHSNDDIWASDDNDRDDGLAWNNGTLDSRFDARSDMLSDLPTVKRQHMTDGYREGLALGKAKVMQQGFDAGYPIGVMIAMRVGKVMGVLEGLIEAKDVGEDGKVVVRKALKEAREELEVGVLLGGVSDEEVLSMGMAEEKSNGKGVAMERVDGMLRKWDEKVFGGSEGR